MFKRLGLGALFVYGLAKVGAASVFLAVYQNKAAFFLFSVSIASAAGTAYLILHKRKKPQKILKGGEAL